MAAPAFVENHKLYHWRDGSNPTFFINSLNVDSSTTYTVTAKSDASIELTNFNFSNSPSNRISFSLRWSGTPINSTGLGWFDLTVADPASNTSFSARVNIEWLGRTSQVPIGNNNTFLHTANNNGHVIVNSASFVTTSTGATALGYFNPGNRVTDGTHIFGSVTYNSVHARQIDAYSGYVWVSTNNPLPFSSNIGGTLHWRQTTGTNAGSLGNVKSLTINGTAPATTLSESIPSYTLTEGKNAVLREIFYLNSLPASVTTTGFPAGVSIQALTAYRYYVIGVPQVGSAGQYTCRLTNFSGQPSFDITVLPQAPVIIEPVPGQLRVVNLVRNRQVTPITINIEPYTTYEIDWYLVNPLPPGLSLGGNNTGGVITGTPTQGGTYTVTIEAYPRVLTTTENSYRPETVLPSDSTTIVFNVSDNSPRSFSFYDNVNFN
jgi:hypothetical protein